MYRAFSISTPVAGVIAAIVAVIMMFDGVVAGGAILLALGLLQIVAVSTVEGANERLEQGEALSTGEKAFAVAALIAGAAIGLAAHVAWWLVSMIWLIFMDVLKNW
jgi:hypothetical protein